MVNYLLEKQSYPCFLCLWDSIAKDQNWVNGNWPLRKVMIRRKQNVINEPLVAKEKIIFPPSHIKLGLMEQFVKALHRNGLCFGYLSRKFSGISMVKLEAGIFNGSHKTQFIKDPQFTASMNKIASNGRCSFVQVPSTQFSRNYAFQFEYFRLQHEQKNSLERTR